MTTVLVRLAVPSPVEVAGRPAWCGPDEVPAVGKLEWQPYAHEHAETPQDRTVLAAAFAVPLVAGEVSVDVEPGYWWVREGIISGRQRRLVLVPDAPTADYGNLAVIDPTTLDPAAEPEAAWWAAWAAMAAGTYLVPDPAHPGLYLIASGSSLTPDPEHSGLYTIGV